MGKKTKTERDKAEITKEKQAKFRRVVQPRVSKAVKALELVGNCAGAGYDYTVEQKAQILEAIGTAFKELLNKFERLEKQQTTFKLED